MEQDSEFVISKEKGKACTLYSPNKAMTVIKKIQKRQHAGFRHFFTKPWRWKVNGRYDSLYSLQAIFSWKIIYIWNR